MTVWVVPSLKLLSEKTKSQAAPCTAAPGIAVNGGPAGSTGNQIRLAGGVALAGTGRVRLPRGLPVIPVTVGHIQMPLY